MDNRAVLNPYDSDAAPEAPHIFRIGGILFAAETNQGELTMVLCESAGNHEAGSAFDLYSIADTQPVEEEKYDAGLELAWDSSNYKRVLIVADTRNKIHIHLGQETKIENVLLHRLEGNGRLPADRYFVEKVQGTTVGRVWGLMQRHFPGNLQLTSQQTVLHGTIWRFQEDDITFEEVGCSGDQVNSRFYKLMKNDGPKMPVDETGMPMPGQ